MNIREHEITAIIERLLELARLEAPQLTAQGDVRSACRQAAKALQQLREPSELRAVNMPDVLFASAEEYFRWNPAQAGQPVQFYRAATLPPAYAVAHLTWHEGAFGDGEWKAAVQWFPRYDEAEIYARGLPVDDDTNTRGVTLFPVVDARRA